MSEIGQLFEYQMRAYGIPLPDAEWRFTREIVGNGPGIRQRLKDADLGDWRFDYAWPALMIAVEIEGGIWTKGRHVRGAGFLKDCKKYNAATEHGWRVFRYPTNMVKDGSAVAQLARVIGVEDGQAE